MGNETQPVSGVSDKEKAGIIAEIEEEIKKIGDDEAEKKKLGEKLLADLKDSESAAKEVVGDEIRIQTGRQANFTKQTEAQLVFESFVRAAWAAKKGIVVAEDPHAQTLLSKLADQSLTRSTAAAIEVTLLDYFTGRKKIEFSPSGQPATQFEKDFQRLKEINPIAAELVARVVIENASEFGLTEEEAKRKFVIEEEEIKKIMQRMERSFDEEFIHAWNQYYARYFDTKDRELINAIYNPEKFKELIGRWRGEIQARGITDEKEIALELSERLEREVVLVFAKIFTRLDREQPTTFFEEIVRQDYYRGIQPTIIEFSAALTKLARYFEAHPEELPGLKFFRKGIVGGKAEEVVVTYKDEEGNEQQRKRVKYRVLPTPAPVETNISEYIRYLEIVLNHYIDAREYTHNVRALFLRPAGEKGFWAGLSEYSSKMTMTDLQEIMALPDADIFLNALWLYEKAVEEEFATFDWIHQSDSFSPVMGDIYNRIELRVKKALEAMYPHISDRETRIRSALSMAVGAARGIFLTEVEKAAFADPQLDEKGNATYRSYYTRDSTPILALNPVHHSLRWQSEGTMSPILFMPLTGPKGRIWDHKEAWENMRRFKESYLQGRKLTLGETLLFIDRLLNIGKIGGVFTRAGWRTPPMYEGYYQYADISTQKLDYITTWKELELIGFEVIRDFINRMIAGERENIMRASQGERDAFFQYLFQRYFSDVVESGKQYGKYIAEIEAEAKRRVEKQLRERQISPTKIEDAIELEKCKIFLSRVQARIIAQRMPTKFLRVSRDRFSDDRSRYWAIREEMGKNPEEFSLIMGNLELAEMMLRAEISEQMRKSYQQGKNLSQIVEQLSFELTEGKIRELLTKAGKTANEIDLAVDLFNRIKNRYLTNTRFLDSIMETDYRSDGFKNYPFTLGLEDTDLSFLMFRASGQTVIPRLIGDVAQVEQNVVMPLLGLQEKLNQIATNGKHDFDELVAMIKKARDTLSGIVGDDYAQEVAYTMAGMIISYFKKDTLARAFGGYLSGGRKNSIAAEFAKWTATVWEWDSREIDAFCTRLEQENIIPKEPFDTSKVPEYEPVYIRIPFTKKFIKLPETFKVRKKDYNWWGQKLRKEHGGDWRAKIFDIANRYLPIVIILLLIKYLKDAIDKIFGKKK